MIIRVFLYATAIEFALFSAMTLTADKPILALVLAGVSALAIIFHRAYTELG